jgi:DNA repair ATPase RecN
LVVRQEKAMSDESWDEQFKQFLRKTGEDFRRTGEDIKAEAQKLFDAAMDPEKQQRVRDRLNELTMWARKTAQGVAGAMEDASSKAQTAFQRATDKVTETTGTPSSTAGAHPAARASSAGRKPAAAAKKTSRAKAKPGKAGQKKSGKRKR